jgi:hypothetical protein
MVVTTGEEAQVHGRYQWIQQETKQPGHKKLEELLMGCEWRWIWMEKEGQKLIKYDRIGVGAS